MSAIKGSLTLADYMAAQRLHLKPRPAFAIIGLVLVLGALATMYFVPTWELGLALTVLAGMFFIYMPFKAKRTFKQFKALSEPVVVDVRENGLFFKSANSEGLVLWRHIIKWRRSNALVLVYPADDFFYILPSSFFPAHDAFLDFVKIVEAKLGRPI